VNRSTASLLAVLAVLVVGVGIGAISRPPVVSASAQGRVAVQRTTVVCPNPAGRTGGMVSAFVPAQGDGGQTPLKGVGSAAFTDVNNAGHVRGALDTVGRLGTIAAGSGVPALVARADGQAAPGFTAEQTTIATSGPERGLASAMCVAPGTDFWFIGTSAANTRQANLYLTNGEDTPAQVDVILFGPNGQLDAPSGRGRTVAAHQQADPLLLSSLVTGSPQVVAVHVVVHTGRLAAALSDLETKNGTDPMGVDWVPASAAPARQVVLPGIPPDATSLQLQVLAPGEQDANVTLRMIGKSGTFTPTVRNTQNGTATAPAARLVSFDLSGITHNEESALLLTADQPILAGVRAVRSADDASEVAFTAGAAGLTAGQRSVLPDNRATKSFTSTVYLSAPGAAGQVDVTTVGSGAPRTQTVNVGSGTTVGVPLTSPGGDVFAVVVTPKPGSGPVFGARLLALKATDGPLFTVQPLAAARESVVVPHIDNEQSTAVHQ
jgi:hypothetical protein